MASVDLENKVKTKASSVDSKPNTKGLVGLSLVFLMIVTGLVAALLVLGTQIQSLKEDNKNLEHNFIVQENISKVLKIRIQKMSQEMENDELMCQAEIKSLTVSKKGLLNDIKELKKQLKPFEEFLKKANISEAAELGNLNIVKLMLQKGTDIDSIGKDGMTPLHLAVSKGHLKVVQFLLNHGARRDLKDQHDYTPLDWAYYKKWVGGKNIYPIIKLLEKN